MVFADDVLLLCHNQHDATQVYFELLNHLHNLALDVNKSKLQQGRFADGVLDFVGFRFSGGSVGISSVKINAFKQGIAVLFSSPPKPFNERAFIKKINQKINGFGHYYKFGNVVGSYGKLDGFTRAQVRQQYKQLGLPYPNSTYLRHMGLVSLEALAKGKKQHIIAAQAFKLQQQHKRNIATQKHRIKNDIYLGYLSELTAQNKQLIALNKGILHELKQLNNLDM